MDALALLRLQIEWGADEALNEAAIDRLGSPAARLAPERLAPERPGAERPVPERPAMERAETTPAPAETARPAFGRPPPVPNGPVPAANSEAAARAAASVAALRDVIAAFDGCALRDTASNLVFAEGHPAAGLLFIGEAPSSAEDRSGRVFDGPAGAFLDRMLQSIGLDRSRVLLSPLLPWRPPGGRPPTPAEIATCLPFLHRLIVLAAPRRLVLLGPLAVRAILGPASRRRAPGWLPATIPGLPEPLPALPMASPETLSKQPAGRRDAWRDLRLLRRTIDEEITQM